MDSQNFLKCHVHGKHFFNAEIKRVLQNIESSDIKKDLFRHIKLPDDLNEIFNLVQD